VGDLSPESPGGLIPESVGGFAGILTRRSDRRWTQLLAAIIYDFCRNSRPMIGWQCTRNPASMRLAAPAHFRQPVMAALAAFGLERTKPSQEGRGDRASPIGISIVQHHLNWIVR
jgi:hypothetical protein